MTRTSPQDPFEDEIRTALAREAGLPAPDRLVARVASVRAKAGPPQTWMGRVRARLTVRPGAVLRLGASILALAVLALAAGALFHASGPGPAEAGPPQTWMARVRARLTVRPGAVLRLGASILALAVLALAAGALFHASGPGPAARGPAASSAQPTAITPNPTTASGSPTTSASTTPSPSRATAPGPVGGPVPAGFSPASVTFVSAADGWLLGSVPCNTRTCAAIVRTTDGGRTWAGIPAPGEGLAPVDLGTGGVSSLRFANPLDGWAFGAGVWATHDGGSSWRRITLPGAAIDSGVWALETAGGLVHTAFIDMAGAGIRIATSPVGRDAWVVSPTTVPFGAGPVPYARLVLSGTTGWVVEVDRTVIDGARLVDGAWRPWKPPCLEANGPMRLAASSASSLVAACDVGVWSTPTGVHLYASADGGTSFTEAQSKVPVFDLQGVAATLAVTVVGGSLSGVGSALVATFDRGRTWAAVHVLQGAGSFVDLGFTTSDQGVAITSSGSADGQLLMTHDGGRTWVQVVVARP